MSDAELEVAYRNRASLPPAQRAAIEQAHADLVVRRNRERGLPNPVPGHDNVENDLDAAATPLTPEPEVKPKAAPAARDVYRQDLEDAGWTAGEADRIMEDEAGMPHAFERPVNIEFQRDAVRGQRSREAGRARFEQSVDDAYGRPASPSMGATYTRDGNGSAYAPVTDFGGGQTAMVDGVEVPVFDLGDGKQRYRLGDVKRAQEAAHDAKWLAGHRELVDSENEKYGHYSIQDGDPRLTQEQEQARYGRKRGELREADQRKAARQYQIDHANDPLTPYEQQQKARRDLVATRAMLAGGAQNLHSSNNALFTALAMLGPADRNAQLQRMMPIDPHRAQMEAVGGQNALNMLRGMNLGQGMDNPLIRAQAAAAQVQTDQARQAMRQEDENVLGEKYAPGDNNILPWWLGGGYNEFTIAEQQQMYDDLIARGYTPAEAQAAVDRQAGKRRASNRADWNK